MHLTSLQSKYNFAFQFATELGHQRDSIFCPENYECDLFTAHAHTMLFNVDETCYFCDFNKKRESKETSSTTAKQQRIFVLNNMLNHYYFRRI